MAGCNLAKDAGEVSPADFADNVRGEAPVAAATSLARLPLTTTDSRGVIPLVLVMISVQHQIVGARPSGLRETGPQSAAFATNS